MLCAHEPRAACSPARHGPGDTPAVVPITGTHHKRHLPAQYGRGSEPERVRSSRRRVHVGRGPCLVVGGIPLTHTHNALPRWCLCEQHHPRCVWEGAGRPWTWLCGRRAAAEARRPTAAHTREEGRTSRMTKISVGLGVSRHRPNNRGRRVGPSYRKAAVITAINRHRWLWANGELPVFSGQPATALQQLKPSMRQKRN